MTAFLLDTHAFIWWCEDSPRLAKSVRDELSSSEARVAVSAVTAWEITIKQKLGKMSFLGPLNDVRGGAVAEAVAFYRFSQLPLTFTHVEAVKELPRHHGDPFDHMLIAQALVEGMTLVSHDRALRLYDVPLLRV